MPITVSCWKCQATLRIDDSKAGRTVACPKCRAAVEIASPEETPPLDRGATLKAIMSAMSECETGAAGTGARARPGTGKAARPSPRRALVSRVAFGLVGLAVMGAFVFVLARWRPAPAVDVTESMRPHVGEFAEIAGRRFAAQGATTEAQRLRAMRSEVDAYKRNPVASAMVAPTTLNGHELKITRDPPPSLRGRVVTLVRNSTESTDTLALHDSYVRLAPELVARTPDEVGTIVVLEFDELEPGQPGASLASARQFCRITCVDRRTARVTAGAWVHAPEPQHSARRATGSAVNLKVIVDWLNSLPREAIVGPQDPASGTAGR